MIPKVQRDADRAVCEATTGGEWIAVQPRSQAGGEAIASFGPSWSDTFPAETHVRMAAASRPLTWEEHAANARFAVVAHEMFLVYIAALDTVDSALALFRARAEKDERRVASLRARGDHAAADVAEARALAFREVLAAMRGEA